MIQISYANFFCNTPEQFCSTSLTKSINMQIKHSSGIYKIENIITNECYIGQSKDIFVRIGQHKSLLKHNKHTYRDGQLTRLQKAWNKYGEENFEFSILYFCPIEELNEQEIYWINYYQCNYYRYGKGYNATDGGEGEYINNAKGRIVIHKDNIQKMIFPSESEYYKSLGFEQGISEKTRQNMKNSSNPQRGENHWNYKGEKSKARIKQREMELYGDKRFRPHTEEHKKKQSDALKGRKTSKETIEKIANSKKKAIVQLTKQYEFVNEFDSGIQAQNQTGIERSHISQCCNGKRQSAGGYIWMFRKDYDAYLQERELSCAS